MGMIRHTSWNRIHFLLELITLFWQIEDVVVENTTVTPSNTTSDGIEYNPVSSQAQSQPVSSTYIMWDYGHGPPPGSYCLDYYPVNVMSLTLYRCYQPIPCDPCPVGSYRFMCQDTSAGQCFPCSVFCDLGSITHQCDDGFSDNSYCEICPAGKYHEPIADVCQKCPALTYNTVPGINMYFNGGSELCTACPVGTDGGEGATTCDKCIPGFIPATTHPLACSACSAGKYSASVADTQCTSCLAGKYSNNGASSCSTCKTGSFSLDGATVCTLCVAGKYNQADNMNQCISCPAGKYNNADGLSTCTDCIDGATWSRAGSTTCSTCTNPTCSNTQYKAKCTVISDTNCAYCTQSIPINALPINTNDPACPWKCNSGFYRNSDSCVPCTTTSEGCSSGQYRQQCVDGGTEDGQCVPCTNGPANSVYTGVSATGITSSCPYVCASSYVRNEANGFCCTICGNGYHNQQCTKVSSGSCFICSN